MVTAKDVLNLAPLSLLSFEEIIDKIKTKGQFFVKINEVEAFLISYHNKQSGAKFKSTFC